MEKLDLTKHYKAYYNAKMQPEIVDIEETQYLSIQGKGDPSGKGFSENVQALYQTAYAVKFLLKKANRDFVIAKLEGQWSFDEEKYKKATMEDAPVTIPRNEWNYTMMIRMPDFVENSHLSDAIDQVVKKKQNQLVKQIKLLQKNKERVVQMMHIGPFDTEPETLKQIKRFMDANELIRNGFHQEIYLTDFNRTAPEKLRTILREPVKF
ncbi:GyrI-like domain-containing protein [Pedobacter nutrimenti]|uniref:GyrI-like domain-containing protein n=1 Tax=Pedobacter nutrimenti TaxID=1241337 RepID=UPI00292F7E34|nr:GyrI-like domain-containing protein [Pedobacter nutrimenti]